MACVIKPKCLWFEALGGCRWIQLKWKEKKKKTSKLSFAVFMTLLSNLSGKYSTHISLSLPVLPRAASQQVTTRRLGSCIGDSSGRFKPFSVGQSSIRYAWNSVFFFFIFFCRLNSRLTPLSALCAVKTHLFYIHSPSVVSSKDRDLCAHVADSLHLRFLCCFFFFCCCSLLVVSWAVGTIIPYVVVVIV